LVLGGFAPDGPSHRSGLPVARRTPDQLAAEFGDAFTLEHAETQSHHTPSGSVVEVVANAREARKLRGTLGTGT
jgi:hypothetical protein